MKTILFICTGNTCRSPMAAAMMNKLLADSKLTNIKAESAGIAANPGEPASLNAIAVMREFGADLTNHRARQTTQEIVDASEIIYTMTATHAAMFKTAFPEAASKINVLGAGIQDPFGGDINVYRSCRDSILAALKKLIEQVK